MTSRTRSSPGSIRNFQNDFLGRTILRSGHILMRKDFPANRDLGVSLGSFLSRSFFLCGLGGDHLVSCEDCLGLSLSELKDL